MNELSRIVTEFKDRFHLSKAKAAKVLGVSTNYFSSLESGVDINTGLPFKPRKGTLRELAARMTEFGYPIDFKTIARAAGIDVDDEPVPPLPAATLELGPKAIRGRHPLTTEERSILKRAEDLHIESFIDSKTDLLEHPSDAPARRRFFLRLEDFVQEVELHQRLHG